MEAGPEIPPHILAKRKRKAEEAAAAAIAAAGPSKPEQNVTTAVEKRPRVIGPAPPPAPLDERPPCYPKNESEDESSDGEIGPALPSGLSTEVNSSFLTEYEYD